MVSRSHEDSGTFPIRVLDPDASTTGKDPILRKIHDPSELRKFLDFSSVSHVSTNQGIRYRYVLAYRYCTVQIRT
jgi:hypothetical protein